MPSYTQHTGAVGMKRDRHNCSDCVEWVNISQVCRKGYCPTRRFGGICPKHSAIDKKQGGAE